MILDYVGLMDAEHGLSLDLRIKSFVLSNTKTRTTTEKDRDGLSNMLTLLIVGVGLAIMYWVVAKASANLGIAIGSVLAVTIGILTIYALIF